MILIILQAAAVHSTINIEKLTLPYTLCCENPGRVEKSRVRECSMITTVPDFTIADERISSGTSSSADGHKGVSKYEVEAASACGYEFKHVAFDHPERGVAQFLFHAPDKLSLHWGLLHCRDLAAASRRELRLMAPVPAKGRARSSPRNRRGFQAR